MTPTSGTTIHERLLEGGVLFDGGMGSMLIAGGLALGSAPEEWNHSHEAFVRGVHLAYLEAGAEVISTNTFGGTPGKLDGHGFGDAAQELNAAGVRLAREAIEEFESRAGGSSKGGHPTSKGHPASDTRARSTRRFIALSVGPTGKMLPPVGAASEEELEAEFIEQIGSVHEDIDLIVIETMYDLREAVIALNAARSIVSVPVGCTLTLDKKPRGFFTIMGNEAARSVHAIEELGADFVGANCTLTSGVMVECAEVIRRATVLPVLCQPNAGQPSIENGMPVYRQSPGEFAADIMVMLGLGINAVGGCCGTTPDFIREIHAHMLRSGAGQ